MNRAGLAAAVGALLLLAGCGGRYSDATQELQPFDTSRNSTRAESSSRMTEREFNDGVTVTVSAPRSFTPTDAAYPHSARAVAFDLVLDNTGKQVYRPSRLSVTATANGSTALQVIDSTQGYTGYMGANEDVPPGQHLHLTVAFAVPIERSEVVLRIQPDTGDGDRVTMFQGGV